MSEDTIKVKVREALYVNIDGKSTLSVINCQSILEQGTSFLACISERFIYLSVCVCVSVVRRYPVFLGRAHRSAQRQELHIQTVLQVNRTLYIGAR